MPFDSEHMQHFEGGTFASDQPQCVAGSWGQKLTHYETSANSYFVVRKPKARAFDVIRGHACMWAGELDPTRGEKDH